MHCSPPLQRFASTSNVQDVSNAVRAVCETESDRLDSELAMVRYIAWAIPSIGFIGTVRGIGDALGQAYQAVKGDIAGVTASLGVAFNSTFVALVISIVVMFLMHQLQLIQERLVLDTPALLRRLPHPSHAGTLGSSSALDVHTQVADEKALRTALGRLVYSRDALVYPRDALVHEMR